MKYTILALAVLLAGCAKAPQPVPKDTINTTYYNVPSGSIYEMRLSDGTRCVYITSGYGAGVTCDWQKESVESL